MATLRDTRTTPPGGWRYVQHETGCVVADDVPELLVKRLVAHRLYKALPRATDAEAWEDVQNQLCMTLGPDFCAGEFVHIKDQTRSLTFSKIIALSSGLLEWIKSGGELADKAESERRAAICRGCPLNKPAATCSCAPFYKLVDAIVPKARQLPGLEICGACGCSLRAKIILGRGAIEASNAGRDLKFPDFCWQK